ncbi:MAG: CCC motif membrane protein [Candidatus Delongbacteria bacterium]|jgi:ABC-type Fe3+ transport system permease subunit|nr:CCC motif membrane protein [Candidatus Delongbacteria bacterium]
MTTENNKQGFEFDPNQQKKPQETNHLSSGNQQSEGYQGSSNATSQQSQPASSVQATTSKMQQPLPNSGGILAMGIISLVLFCCCYGVISIVLAIIALILSSKAQREYMQNPDLYTYSSYKNMRAGRVTAIIGLCLAAVIIIIMVIALASGLDVLNTKDALHEIEQAWESTGY